MTTSIAHKRIMGPARDRMRKQAVAAYAKGKSIREIAAAQGRSYGFVHRLLGEEGGTQLRQRGGYRRNGK